MRRYQRDPASREEVAEQFLPLVRTLAWQYKRGEEPYDDLVGAGSVGLVKALQRCDLDQGHFIAFAIPTITGEIRRHFRDTGWGVHVPRRVQVLAQRVTNAQRSLYAQTGHEASTAELAEHLGETVGAIDDARIAAHGQRAGPLDRSRDDDAPEAASAVLAVTVAGFVAAEDRATLSVLLKGLGECDREIVTLRYAGDLTQREIGERIGLSQVHVSRRLRAATEHMGTMADRLSA